MKSVLRALEAHVEKRFVYISVAGMLASLYVMDGHLEHAILTMVIAFMDVE